MSGTRTGFNYTAVAARAHTLPEYTALDTELQNYVWEGLQRMELAVMKQCQSET